MSSSSAVGSFPFLSPPLPSPQPFVPVPSKFGRFQGQDVLECQLQSESSVTVKVINYGAVIRDWQVPMPDGSRRSVVLGFDTFAHYARHSPFFGAIVGRVANRIGRARFTLDGKEYILEANEGPNQLHGGAFTFGKRLWRMRPLSVNSVQLELHSHDGEGGYPGTLYAKVVYKLVGHRLSIDFEAETDAPTPVNLVQHNYFNLAGNANANDGGIGADVRNHWLQLNADSFTPTDANNVPTGQIQPVKGTKLDFRTARPLKDPSNAENASIFLDYNFVLNGNGAANGPLVVDGMPAAAVLHAPDNSLELRLWTNQPGMQVYTSGHLALGPDVPGLHGQRYPQFGGICLEDQHFPDAINHPGVFPSPVLRPGKRYRHACVIEIAVPSSVPVQPVPSAQN